MGMGFWEFLCQPAIVWDDEKPQQRRMKYVDQSISNDDIARLLVENKQLKKQLIVQKAEQIEQQQKPKLIRLN